MSPEIGRVGTYELWLLNMWYDALFVLVFPSYDLSNAAVLSIKCFTDNCRYLPGSVSTNQYVGPLKLGSSCKGSGW